MPDMFAHYLVAEAAARRSGTDVTRLVDHAFDSYKVGAQGPDVFFYSHVLRPGGRALIPWLTHRRRMTAAFGSMLAHAAALSAGHREAAFAFVAGYAAHLCLDGTVHPWVMYWTGDITGTDGGEGAARTHLRHGLLEASVDLLLCRERSDDSAWLRQQRLLHLPPAQRAVVTALLSRMLDDVYGIRFTPREGRSAFRAMDRLYSSMTDPHALSTRLLEVVAPLAGRGEAVRAQIYPKTPAPCAVALLSERRTWYHPCIPETPRTETFAELRESATLATARCLEAVAAVAERDARISEAVAVIGDHSMITGLPCDDRRPATVFAPDLNVLWGGATD